MRGMRVFAVNVIPQTRGDDADVVGEVKSGCGHEEEKETEDDEVYQGFVSRIHRSSVGHLFFSSPPLALSRGSGTLDSGRRFSSSFFFPGE